MYYDNLLKCIFMKNFIATLIICSLLPIIGRSINLPDELNTRPKLMHILEREGIDSYKIPAFLVRFALNFCDESKEILPLFRGSHSISIAICENESRQYDESYNRICKSLDQSSYLNFVDIIDRDSRITIKALLKDEVIREIVALIRDHDSFIAVSMAGTIDPKSIAETITKLNRHKSHNI